MPSATRSILGAFLRLAQYELADVDALVAWFEEGDLKRIDELERSASMRRSSDRYMDQRKRLDFVARLNADLSIIALWRCVELCRKRVIGHRLGEASAREAAYNTKAVAALRSMGIVPTKIEGARDTDELRRLNNAIKHDGYIDKQLATFETWRDQEGMELSNLASHYSRLRAAAEVYLKDLVRKAEEL
jgi:hypothetical protein